MLNLKKNKGITLVALIVTIIILIILAGITINALVGENGLINKVILARQRYENSQNAENEILNSIYSKIYVATNEGSEITLNYEELNDLINKKVEEKIEAYKLTVDQNFSTVNSSIDNLRTSVNGINNNSIAIKTFGNNSIGGGTWKFKYEFLKSGTSAYNQRIPVLVLIGHQLVENEAQSMALTLLSNGINYSSTSCTASYSSSDSVVTITSNTPSNWASMSIIYDSNYLNITTP